MMSEYYGLTYKRKEHTNQLSKLQKSHKDTLNVHGPPPATTTSDDEAASVRGTYQQAQNMMQTKAPELAGTFQELETRVLSEIEEVEQRQKANKDTGGVVARVRRAIAVFQDKTHDQRTADERSGLKHTSEDTRPACATLQPNDTCDLQHMQEIMGDQIKSSWNVDEHWQRTQEIWNRSVKLGEQLGTKDETIRKLEEQKARCEQELKVSKEEIKQLREQLEQLGSNERTVRNSQRNVNFEPPESVQELLDTLDTRTVSRVLDWKIAAAEETSVHQAWLRTTSAANDLKSIANSKLDHSSVYKATQSLIEKVRILCADGELFTAPELEMMVVAARLFVQKAISAAAESSSDAETFCLWASQHLELLIRLKAPISLQDMCNLHRSLQSAVNQHGSSEPLVVGLLEWLRVVLHQTPQAESLCDILETSIDCDIFTAKPPAYQLHPGEPFEELSIIPSVDSLLLINRASRMIKSFTRHEVSYNVEMGESRLSFAKRTSSGRRMPAATEHQMDFRTAASEEADEWIANHLSDLVLEAWNNPLSAHRHL